MQIRVRTFARFREILGGDLAIDLPDGATMAAVLAALRGRAGEEGDAVFDESGGLREYVILMHNGKRVRRTEAATLALADGDEVALFPPVAGG
ncbi:MULTISPECIES: ubiquitin-like small modifier protein 1 [Methanoculleus]|jgi:molybdopterin synthase sulfur carrier subunit|uniref:Molybdopterin synthase sulfur carrier subunit n=1 Tax=Methanoculleus thermophilus TaxID=2200 RepID=A0A1G9ATE7_9EURY|nr:MULTISPECIES: ubiquitin-like small modifier protein 1 [Methanoculleus]NLN08407.1 MoaD/ThiS family protein [Methanoculleus thermophilus]SDK30154.1 molybdopterin synthase sulfur carrier subunit [Methanoculleus thermophilus]HQD25928.1 MoaD/ThiS family protein [Methanoculleus thermophilus]